MTAAPVTRRRFVAGGMCGCLLHAGAAQAQRVRPETLAPLAGTGFRPVDADERGLWQSCDELEREIASSELLVRSPELQHYAAQVVARLLGDRAGEARVYVVHSPEFNASMAPNGMMLVNTGLLIRMRDEAQFAAVLGHECGHYLRRHSVQRWRDQKAKTGIMAFVSVGASVGVGVTAAMGGAARSWIDLANSINGSLALSIMRFSRENELEADAYGVKLIDAAGYPPEAAAATWSQYVDERRGSALARYKKYRDGSTGAWSTHPANAARMVDLSVSAREIRAANLPERAYDARKEAWDAVTRPLRGMLLDEQIRLNDPGANLYLIEQLARDGWDAPLRYGEGEVYRLRDEPGDADRAAAAYAQAVTYDDAPAVAWRAHGYALLKRGRGEDGRRALAHYLTLEPAAGDAAMIRFSMNQ